MQQPVTFLSLWKMVRSQKKEFWKVNLLSVGSTLLFLPIPILIPLLIDEVLLHHPGKLVAAVETLFHSREPAVVIAVTLGTVLSLRFAVFLMNNRKTLYATRIVQKTAYGLRHRLLHHLERLSLSEFETLQSGRIASKTVQDVESISGFVGRMTTVALSAALTLAGVAAVMFWISWPLAVVVFTLNPLFLALSRRFGKKVGELRRRQHEAYSLYHEMLNETLELFVQVRAGNREHTFFGLLRDRAGAIRRAATEYGYGSSVAQSSSNLLTQTVVDLFRALGIAAVAYTGLSIGMMLGFLFYLSTIVQPVQQLMSLAISYQSVKPSLERLNRLLSMKREPNYPHEEDPFAGRETTDVRLENIDFAYGSGEKVLHGVSIRAAAGEKIALVGPSGGGKTTIAQLMVGFYTPQKGEILYGGVPVEKIGLPVVRENVALMLQQSLFFNDTVRMNLTLGRTVDEKRLFEALRMAQIDGFVRSLENGLDTRIGKNGIRLSGGQRQRLAVARLILGDPKIVIFDEATSALDGETEYRLYDTLAPFLKNRTTVIVAHRETTIRQADRIYVVENGRVTAEGRYEALLAEGVLRTDGGKGTAT